MGNKEKNFASAVIYIHNAEERAGYFLKSIISVMEKNFEHSEIICVNDASEDGSLEAIRKEGRQAASSSVSVVNMSYFHGVEAAMNAGVDLAIGDFVFEFDNTVLDFHVDEIMRAYQKVLEGYDIVSASAEKRERLTSKIFYKIFDLFTELPYEMCTESFRILSRRAINRTSSTNKAIPYRKAVYANCGLKTDHMRYKVVKAGGNNYSKDKKEQGYRAGLAINSLLLFTEAGSRLSMIMTVLMMAVSLFMILYSVTVYVAAHPVAGWTTTILFLSIVFFGLFGVLTIVIKYLQIIIDLIFKRRRYSFEEIEKLTK